MPTTTLKYALRYVPLLLLLLLLLPWNLMRANWPMRSNTPRPPAWSPYVQGPALYGVTMLSANDVWVAGGTFRLEKMAQQQGSNLVPDSGVILHYTDGVWVEAGLARAPLFSVSFATPRDGWAVGYGGLLVHYNGEKWSSGLGPANFNKNLLGVAMVSSMDGWAVGYGGSILHFDGRQWTLYPSPTVNDLRAIAMVSSTDGWAVGDDGTILHYHAGNWSLVKSSPATGSTLRSITMLSADEGWAVGDNGTILHYRAEDSAWASVYHAPTAQNAQFIGVAMSTVRTGWIIGSRLLAYRAETWTAPASAGCSKKNAQPTIGQYASLYSIALSSADEGWAVGQDESGPLAYSLLHYTHGQWCADPSFK